MILIKLFCSACYTDIATGPPSAATFGYFTAIEKDHQCPVLATGTVAELPEGSTGALSREELDRLGVPLPGESE